MIPELRPRMLEAPSNCDDVVLSGILPDYRKCARPPNGTGGKRGGALSHYEKNISTE